MSVYVYNNLFFCCQIADEFVGSCSESEVSEVSSGPGSTSAAYLLNNFAAADRSLNTAPASVPANSRAREQTRVSNDGGQGEVSLGRPQRRKRSMEERHPDFVLQLPVKVGKSNPSDSQQQVARKKTKNEI